MLEFSGGVMDNKIIKLNEICCLQGTMRITIEITQAEFVVFNPLQMQSCIYHSMITLRRTKRAVTPSCCIIHTVLYPFLKKIARPLIREKKLQICCLFVTLSYL